MLLFGLACFGCKFRFGVMTPRGVITFKRNSVFNAPNNWLSERQVLGSLDAQKRGPAAFRWTFEGALGFSW